MRNILYIHGTITPRTEKRLAGVRRYLKTSGWDVRLVELANTMPHLRETLTRWDPLGCIVDRGAAHGTIPRRLFGKMPSVFIDQGSDVANRDVWIIRHDSCASARAAINELKRLSPRHFAFVREARNLAWSRERETTFLRQTPKNRSSVLDDNAQLAERLAELPKPCGVFAANDTVAQHVLNAAILAKIDMPGDLQVVGINNDTFICENTTPTLTSVEPDFERSGYLAAETLHRAIGNPHLRPRTLTHGPLSTIRRASTRILTQTDPRVTQALDLIAVSFADPKLTTDTLAKKIGCSRRLLDLRFREITGQSVRETLRAARIEEAKRLAADRTYALTAIPALCGYTSAGTFLRTFKKATGQTLSEFRRKKKPS